jgi:hypothetical protein
MAAMNGSVGWFNRFRKAGSPREYVRFMWSEQGKKQLVYLGSLGPEPDCPIALLNALVAKIQRMDYQKEDEQQRDKHLEMLLRLREVDKSWEGLN